MYIVNTSFMVDPAIHDRWLESLRKHYLPLLAAQGFDKITFTRVLPATAEEHFTYSLQVEVGELFEEYAATARDLFGDKLMWFNSLLKKVEY